ncbi:MAG: VCBS repeat-containing protein [Candidatus Aenigmarchaeota archaeon]|nr:VCBS repeat-containing protein [Candidatus Aenigmarchaeota archaeon]
MAARYISGIVLASGLAALSACAPHYGTAKAEMPLSACALDVGYPQKENTRQAADFNGDGIMDYAALSKSGDVLAVHVFTGHGDGSYSGRLVSTIRSDAEFDSFGAYDSNLDGSPDIIINVKRMDAGPDRLVSHRFFNDGTGEFSYNGPANVTRIR